MLHITVYSDQSNEAIEYAFKAYSWSMTEVDREASYAKLDALILEAVRAAYPAADVSLDRWDHAEQPCEVLGSQGSYTDEANVADIINEVWDSCEWIVREA